MTYINSKNLFLMVVLFLIMALTFYHALTFEDNKIYTNVNGYNIQG